MNAAGLHARALSEYIRSFRPEAFSPFALARDLKGMARRGIVIDGELWLSVDTEAESILMGDCLDEATRLVRISLSDITVLD